MIAKQKKVANCQSAVKSTIGSRVCLFAIFVLIFCTPLSSVLSPSIRLSWFRPILKHYIVSRHSAAGFLEPVFHPIHAKFNEHHPLNATPLNSSHEPKIMWSNKISSHCIWLMKYGMYFWKGFANYSLYIYIYIAKCIWYLSYTQRIHMHRESTCIAKYCQAAKPWQTPSLPTLYTRFYTHTEWWVIVSHPSPKDFDHTSFEKSIIPWVQCMCSKEWLPCLWLCLSVLCTQKMSSLSELGIHTALQHILRMNLYISQKQVWKAMRSKPFLSKIIKHNHSSSCTEGPWCHQVTQIQWFYKQCTVLLSTATRCWSVLLLKLGEFPLSTLMTIFGIAQVATNDRYSHKAGIHINCIV